MHKYIKPIDQYIAMPSGDIVKVIQRAGYDIPLAIGETVLVQWNDTTMIKTQVVRIATLGEYNAQWQGL